MKYSKKQIQQAFEKWTIQSRLEPSTMFTTEHQSQIDAKELSKLDAETLINFIKNK